MVTRDWEESWAPLRSRRVMAAVAIVAAIPLWFTLGAPGLLLGFALLFLPSPADPEFDMKPEG